MCFDDLDPDCLTGGISFSGAGFGRLWDLCHMEGLRVVADVHTHPDQWVSQSETDRTNPMVASRGHVGIIIPHFAQGDVRSRDIGFHVYEGEHRWSSSFTNDAAQQLRLTWW